MADPRAPGSFLGVGWGFPPRFTAGGAEVVMVAGERDVEESLRVLLATRPGERPMQEGFGCGLDAVMFEEIDSSLINRVTNLIYDAVLQHEPRVDLREVDAAITATKDGARYFEVQDNECGACNLCVDVCPVEGCITMGLGYCLSEELQFRGGAVDTQNFDTYEIPRFSWIPTIDTVLVDDDRPPQGGGEPAIVPMGAAVANAVADATGARIERLPITRERVRAALE